MRNFNQRVYEIVRMIPRGYVASYGQIARLAGDPQASRIVGYALHGLPDPEFTPWQRVVRKDGSLAPFLSDRTLQYKLLKAEGVAFDKNRRVKMEKHRWDEEEFYSEL